MKAIQDKLTSIEFDHSLWLNELAFVLKEIAIYEDRILQLIERNSDEAEEIELGKVLLGFVEQKDIVDQIKGQIKGHLIHTAEKIHSNGELKSIVNTEHHKTREDMELLRKDYGLLKEKIHRLPAFRE